jgi:hypothetical protein
MGLFEAYMTGYVEKVADEAIKAPPQFLPPNFESIPTDLKQRCNWVLWFPVWTGTKWTKRPIQPSGFGASTTNSRHWSSFEDVRRVYQRAAQQSGILVREKIGNRFVPIGGVGFVFDNQPDESGLVLAGVDFDHVISTEGKIAQSAAEHIKRLGSYWERSVSGSGIHVICKAEPLPAGIAHGGVELYTCNRYFTVTGRTDSKPLTVVAADREFAALADKLRAQNGGSPSGDGNTANQRKQVTPPGGFPGEFTPADAERIQRLFGPQFLAANELSAGIEAYAWVDNLTVEKRSEVIRYAALHIANASNLFELTRHGGNFLQYLRLALAIARSGTPDAEDVFVEAALTAKDADSEHKLRDFFRSCECAQAPSNPVTVGTLLHHANECGADFSRWKLLADAGDLNPPVGAPG